MASQSTHKKKTVLLRLTAEMTDLLSEAAIRSGRSNTSEAMVRLEDSLKYFPDLAAPGRRFKAEGNC